MSNGRANPKRPIQRRIGRPWKSGTIIGRRSSRTCQYGCQVHCVHTAYIDALNDGYNDGVTDIPFAETAYIDALNDGYNHPGMTRIVSNNIQAHVFRKRHGRHEFLLLQRADDEPIYPLMWQVVTGYQVEGETAQETAVREIREETGLYEGTLYAIPHITSFFHARTDSVCLVPVFAFEVSPEAIVTLSAEHRAYSWEGFEEALTRLPVPGHRDAMKILMEYILDAGSSPEIFVLD